MVKVDLITGFLGSGKTTFLLNYARYLMRQGERIGILEYDYGAVNVDMLLLGQLRGPKCELEMLAAACDEDCLKRRFKTKLIAMAMSGYDRVIIEPSGIFDMDQFYDTLRDEPLENWYEIGNVITVVSAMLENDIGREADFWLASQAACAGCVVFSKTQLATEQELADAKLHLKNAAESIKCKGFATDYLEIDWKELSDDDYRRLANCGYHIGNYVKTVAGNGSGFDSVSSLKVKDNLEEIKGKIEQLFAGSYGNVFRVKGFIIDDGGSYQVNATRNGITIEPISIGQGTVIVIGDSLDKKAIQELLEQ